MDGCSFTAESTPQTEESHPNYPQQRVATALFESGEEIKISTAIRGRTDGSSAGPDSIALKQILGAENAGCQLYMALENLSEKVSQQ